MKQQIPCDLYQDKNDRYKAVIFAYNDFFPVSRRAQAYSGLCPGRV
jgi:hypothetical protein